MKKKVRVHIRSFRLFLELFCFLILISSSARDKNIGEIKSFSFMICTTNEPIRYTEKKNGEEY